MELYRELEKYKGKTLEEVIEIEKKLNEERLARYEQEKQDEKDLIENMIKQKYYKIDFNGLSVAYIEIVKFSSNEKKINWITTYVDSKRFSIQLEERPINLIWFRNRNSTNQKVSEITKDQFDFIMSLFESNKEKIKTERI